MGQTGARPPGAGPTGAGPTGAGPPGAGPPGAGAVAEKMKDSPKRYSQMLNLLE